MPAPELLQFPSSQSNLMEVLYLDQWLLVVNKPAGLLSIQDGYDVTMPHIRQLLEPTYGRCWTVHRLDKGTSGTLLLARTKESHRLLSIMFENREIKKEYRAVIIGRPEKRHFEIELPLRVDADRHHRTRVDSKNGKPASTAIEVLESNGNFSLVAARPLSGYTHQIRAHLAHLHFPLYGDPLYQHIYPSDSVSTNNPGDQLALHAYSLTFEHPLTHKRVEEIAPMPSWFEELVK
jgi:RluA family pseudouridine synthase